MQTVTDTEGRVWNVYIIKRADHINQICPNHTQITIGAKGPERGITLPADIVARWVANEIRVKVRI